MNSSEAAFWQKHVANIRLDLSVAAYTKVPLTWNDDHYIPDFNKFYFIVEGEGYVRIGNREYAPKPGQLFLLPAGSLQSYGTTGANTFGKYWCHFTAHIGDFPLFQVLQTPAFAEISDSMQLKDKFEQLIAWQHRKELTAGIRTNAILLEIIALFLEQGRGVEINTATAASLEKINRVLVYIEGHLAEPISVEELAQIAHFHPNYLIRLFKKTTGLPPIQYINRMRIEKAKQLLNFTSLNVSAVADSLHMDVSYFSRMFRDYTGCSPSEYRELRTPAR